MLNIWSLYFGLCAVSFLKVVHQKDCPSVTLKSAPLPTYLNLWWEVPLLIKAFVISSPIAMTISALSHCVLLQTNGPWQPLVCRNVCQPLPATSTCPLTLTLSIALALLLMPPRLQCSVRRVGERIDPLALILPTIFNISSSTNPSWNAGSF